MARIRYIAILSEDPTKLEDFYRTEFGMSVVDRSPSKDVSLSDGAFNLSILKIRPNLGEARMEPGLHHIGVVVDDIERTKARFRRRYPRGVMVPEVGGAHHGELRFYDPEAAPVSVSRRGFATGNVKPGESILRDIVFDALDPEALREFYVHVFGFTPLQDGMTSGEHAVTDGQTRILIRPFYGERPLAGRRYGISRLGLKGAGVCDPDGNRLEAAHSDSSARSDHG